jgi:hypothetical protein
VLPHIAEVEVGSRQSSYSSPYRTQHDWIPLAASKSIHAEVTNEGALMGPPERVSKA